MPWHVVTRCGLRMKWDGTLTLISFKPTLFGGISRHQDGSGLLTSLNFTGLYYRGDTLLRMMLLQWVEQLRVYAGLLNLKAALLSVPQPLRREMGTMPRFLLRPGHWGGLLTSTTVNLQTFAK